MASTLDTTVKTNMHGTKSWCITKFRSLCPSCGHIAISRRIGFLFLKKSHVELTTNIASTILPPWFYLCLTKTKKKKLCNAGLVAVSADFPFPATVIKDRPLSQPLTLKSNNSRRLRSPRAFHRLSRLYETKIWDSLMCCQKKKKGAHIHTHVRTHVCTHAHTHTHTR